MGAAKKLESELTETTKTISWGKESLEKGAPPVIELQDAHFSYGEDAFALKNIAVKNSSP